MTFLETEGSQHTVVDPGSFTQLLHPDWVSMDVDKLGKSLYNYEEQPLNEAIKGLKLKALKEALNNRQDDVLIEYLRSSEGLVNNELRRRVWPMLMNSTLRNEDSLAADGCKSLKLNDDAATSHLLDSFDLPVHKDEDQVMLDIQRSFTMITHLQSFPNQNQTDSFANIYSKSDINELKKSLLCLIVKILRKYPSLNYYQGYHDVASIILIVCLKQDGKCNSIDEELAFKILEKLTIFHLRDFMVTDINLSVNHLKLIPSILESADPQFFELLKQTSNSYILSNGLDYDYKFFQGLSSILTIFSHDMASINHILLIWDFFLSYDSVLVDIYVYVASLLYFRDDIFSKLNISSDDDLYFETIDQDVLHSLVAPSGLFHNLSDLDLIKILNKAKSLINEYPVNNIENSETTFNIWFKEFNKSSVLLNTSNLYSDREVRNEIYKDLIISDSEFDSNSLTNLLRAQEEEISEYTAYSLALQNKILAQQDEMSNSLMTEGGSSHLNLLSSSLTSLASSTSSINTKIAHTSSILFKKLFDVSRSGTDDDKDKKVSNRNKATQLSKRFYKLSFTIGFVGFLIHFLLAKYDHNLFSFVGRSFQETGYFFMNKDSFDTITKEVTQVTNEIIDGAFDIVKGAIGTIKGSGGFGVGQVGLGNMRDVIYAPM
ncbi:uncharacterized protein PRCAT00003029001 [Priceomyces carsonii]|uniref:uncharacterized protein n=1 Tax=Priceomyces carsonii TaxID=28549 RepID=UPI002EDB25F4|nr:unnamed protein product [Priceomyces carsonii]